MAFAALRAASVVDDVELAFLARDARDGTGTLAQAAAAAVVEDVIGEQ
jgi:hypothetical protein